MVGTLERKRRRGERVVEQHTKKDYYCCGKKVNKNVYELQQLYETTQAKTTKILPEFIERIRFLVVRGILKATFAKQVDQNGELFSYVLEELLNKIVPKLNTETKKLTTKYDSTKANLGAYILNSCYWSVMAYNERKKQNDALLSCSDFMEDYQKVSEQSREFSTGQLKLIQNYEIGNSIVPLIQQLLERTVDD